MPEPPDAITDSLGAALGLLATLEDARDALIHSGHLATVVDGENEVRGLGRKLGFDEPQGGPDDH